MNRAVRFRAGSAAQRAFRYQPPDPVWAPTQYVNRVRAALRRYDPRVAIWWAGNRGRWRIMEWIHSRATWSHVIYWEGPAGQYRMPEPGSMMRLLSRLAKNTEEVIANLDVQNERLDQKRRDELIIPSREYLKDIADRAVGGKLVIGGNHIRSRDWLKKEAVGHHRQFVVDHLRRQNTLRNGG